MTMSLDLPLGTKLVAGSFTLSGVLHLVKPQVFEQLIPPVLGPPRAWVVGSGVVELVCAAGLVTGQRWAPAATAVTLAGLAVGNVQMALDFQRSRRPAWQKAAVWARIPLQVPMIRAAWNSPTQTPK